MSPMRVRSPWRVNVALAATLLSLGVPAVAQNDDIVVTGQSRKSAERQVGQIMQRPALGGSLALWREPICARVMGLDANLNAEFRTRIEANARRIGIEVAKSGCAVNAVVAFVPGARQQLLALREADSVALSGMSRWQFDEIIGAPATPAFAWKIEETRSRFGEILTTPDGTPTLPTWFPSRLTPSTRQDFAAAIVLIDLNAAMDKDLGQIADYATMYLLAAVKVPQRGEFAHPTVLSAFHDPNAPTALTAFDLAFLTGYQALPINGSPRTLAGKVGKAFGQP